MSLTGDTLELIQARRRRIDVEEEFDIIRSNDNDLDFEDPTEVAARSLKLKTAKSTVKKTKKKLGAAISSEDEEQDTAIVEDIASELDKIEIKGAVIKATKGIVKADLRNLESGKLLNTALFDPKLLEDNLQSTDFDGKAIAASLVWVPSKIDAWMPAKVIQFDQGVAVVKVIGGDVRIFFERMGD
jgi:ribosomal protein S20